MNRAIAVPGGHLSEQSTQSGLALLDYWIDIPRAPPSQAGSGPDTYSGAGCCSNRGYPRFPGDGLRGGRLDDGNDSGGNLGHWAADRPLRPATTPTSTSSSPFPRAQTPATGPGLGAAQPPAGPRQFVLTDPPHHPAPRRLQHRRPLARDVPQALRRANTWFADGLRPADRGRLLRAPGRLGAPDGRRALYGITSTDVTYDQ